jgi:dCTP diphosphatase
MNVFKRLEKDLKIFAQERDWEQFHSPKNLVMALSVEASELVEIFQWKTELASKMLNENDRIRVADELADIQMYLLRITEVLGIDMERAVKAKMAKNAEKYPAELVRGSAKKYDQY